MFRLFKKKPDPSPMFSDGRWCIAQGNFNGEPVIVRVNIVLKPFAGKTDHNLKIGFAIPLNDPHPGGWPNPEENEQIGRIEDRIYQVLKEKGSVVQALTITMGTFKELVFYAKPDMDVKRAHEQLMDEIESHKVQCYAQIEDDWKTYKEWADN
ncbi:MAG: DUF695 domain-containing protein [Anaerolineales bacterium]|nr:DUF695 domain-containing protein [Anaerolineales bacterium]